MVQRGKRNRLIVVVRSGATNDFVLFFTNSTGTKEIRGQRSGASRIQTNARCSRVTAVTTPIPIAIVAAVAHFRCSDISAVFSEIARRANSCGLDGCSMESLAASLAAREAIAFTSTPEGVAFPHVIQEAIAAEKAMAIVLTLAEPVTWGSHQVRIVLALFGSPAEPWRHVRMLARAARVCMQPDTRQRFMDCASDTELLDLFTAECNNHG